MPQPQPTQSNDEPRSYLLAWTATLLLILTFVLGLLMYPPMFGDAKPVEPTTPMLFLGRFHPILVHLPVGILALLVLIEAACLKRSMEEKLGVAALLALWVGAAGGVMAVMAGILLSREGGYNGPNFTLHQGMGVAATCGILIALVLRIVAMSTGRTGAMESYRGFFLFSVVALAIGAHFGGNMVHGNKYLIEYAPQEVAAAVTRAEKWLVGFVEKPKPEFSTPDAQMAGDPASSPAPSTSAESAPTTAMQSGSPSGQEPPVTDSPSLANVTPTAASDATLTKTPSDTPPPQSPTLSTETSADGNVAMVQADDSKLVFDHVILPILELKCNKCHNEEKSKGDLRMDTYDLLIKGGSEEGMTVIPGKPDESLAMVRILMPLDDDEHMPPEGKDQMNQEEIALLRWWIQQGASNTMKVKDAKFPVEAKSLVEQYLAAVTAMASPYFPTQASR